MRNRPNPFRAGLAAAVIGATAVAPALADHDTGEQVMYGFDRESGKLVRHVLGSSGSHDVGHVLSTDNSLLTGIDGAAYVPGFQNIFAFWTDPQSHVGRFVYVDIHSAEATLAEERVEGGRVTGAVAVKEGGKNVLYAVQLAETTPPKPISGEIRLNPNNSDQMQFDLVQIDENGNFVRAWSRDDLLNARQGDVDNNGTLISGYAANFRIRPIGQGGQRDIQLGDETITLLNSNTYTFTSGDHSPMKIRVYNSRSGHSGSNNLNMGHWYLAIEGGQAIQGEEAEVVTPRRLVRVMHQDTVEINQVTGEAFDMPAGTAVELFPLSRDYDGLASTDGQQFYATSENRLYRIDRANETETLVASLTLANIYGLEFIGNDLVGFEINNNRFGTFNFGSNQFDALKSVAGMNKFGAIVFCDYDKDPNATRAQFVSYD
ncbi:hypothetical protein ACERK3_18300 [Phycisphaerales bacterium AB-hyl4]|uniref:Phytase-like domain-containing protein n=1 Tax=Natronomicrosphaera hydrolytica TaxID=3242702 RepID=A0ABV4UAW1_9BACT